MIYSLSDGFNTIFQGRMAGYYITGYMFKENVSRYRSKYREISKTPRDIRKNLEIFANILLICIFVSDSILQYFDIFG